MKHIFKLLIASVLLISFAGCDDFLSFDPSGALGEDAAFTRAKDIENALNGAYYTLGTYRLYGRDVVALGDIAADNAWMTGSSGHFDQIYKYTVNTDSGDLLDIWSYGYYLLDRCTRLIKAGNEMLATDISDKDKTSIKKSIAQAYALKALSHFTLVNIFGLPYSEANKGSLGVVIIDEEVVPAFSDVSRSTVEQVYAQILKEISLARQNIQLTDKKDVFHFNEVSLFALEARVKLYMKDYAGAISAAKDAIAKREGALVMNADSYVNMWFDIVATSEDIFTIGKTVDSNLSSNSLNTLYGSYNGKATSGLINIFEKKDMRLGLFGDGTGEQIRALKFDGLSSSRATSNIPVFRLPEMYLIIAESKAQLGESDAVDYVYEIAKRNPDLDKSEIPTGKDALLRFISIERRRELFQEGHRWYDLRRTGEIMTREGGNFVISNWDASKFVYPIPAKEVNASGLQQNDGWNNALPK
ncbi:MAG: RagB/SusD family nutrient uptake outer membrane protein [Tannerellaceae bacterium]|jgi:hypothetical protein|nr:RagB/SusD family nutrient uptake outer membrane protein [Tannerellaceae bacterium]